MQCFILDGMAAYLHLIADSEEYCKMVVECTGMKQAIEI